MFKQQKGKSTFLQKKNQEKAKTAEQQRQKMMVLRIQKNVRAFIERRQLANQIIATRNIKLSLIMKSKLEHFSFEEIKQFVSRVGLQQESSRLFYLSELVIQNASEWPQLIFSILNYPQHHHLRLLLMHRPQFVDILSDLMGRNVAQSFINAQVENLREVMEKIEGEIVLRSLLFQFRENKMELQNSVEFCREAILMLIGSLFGRFHRIQKVSITEVGGLVLYYISTIDSSCGQGVQRILCYLLQQLLMVGLGRHQQIALSLMKQSAHIISLIEDEEMLQEVQSKMRRHEFMQDFTNDFLSQMRNAMTHPVVLQLFYSGKCEKLNAMLLKMVSQLAVLFDDCRLIFIREIISTDSVLSAISESRDPMFREGLKMRLLAMDDPQFKAFNIFSNNQWEIIIRNCVEVVDVKIQKLIEKSQKQGINKLIPFKKRNKDQMDLKTAVDLLTNLHKKILRTGKFNPAVFVDYGLSAQLQNFLFGKGAMRMEQFLRQLPFLFSFESRMGKFKEFVKADKSNYDRSLFLQEEIPDDLIISVRRGNEFMDAFEACMTRDLRQKYKIVFYNVQGLQEQGIDGGGIIKEFINRVLRSAFSENYQLFMDTPLNAILPNPYSNAVSQYQFVGRLVGKAVYEGINIQQKFAQPFLNLLIGRQNTFEDLQFIDPEIYRNLINLKNMSEDVAELQQTFVIYDHMPNGQKKLVDLLCPSKPPTGKQVLVTNHNKMDFILSYSDYKCNKQIEQKTRLFRRGFLKVMKPQWLAMFSNEQLNSIISGANPDFNVQEMKEFTIYNDYHEKDQTILLFWQMVKQMSCQQKSLLLLYITSCSRPPTLGFGAMKPRICITRDNDVNHLPTANTCMNVMRLPNYKNKAILRKKIIYAINSKAGFQFA